MAGDPETIARAEVEEEQAFLDEAYAGLEAMRDEATRMLDSVLDLGRGGTFQSRTERDIVVRTSLARLAQLDIGDEALCFGRIDRLPDRTGEPATDRLADGLAEQAANPASWETFHIGRLAVSGADHEPLVVDWRAPVAEPFYRATGLDPRGLARRRHLAVRRRQVLGVEDEYFIRAGTDGRGPAGPAGSTATAAPAAHAGGPAAADGHLEDGLVLGGPGALLVALGRARTGRMADIVATIQREQDEIIRSPLTGLLMVQGGPGTGKTAVALHRAAYLLYTHRFPLERQGVLVVGPNPLFLRYIEQVLPSLGESGVTLSTVSGLVADVRPRAEEPAELACLKGDARMARVLARAVRTRERGLTREVAVPFGASVARLTVADSEAIVTTARRRRGTHNSRRRFVEQMVVQRLASQISSSRWGADEPDAAAGSGSRDLAELRGPLLRVPEVAIALDRMWPRLSAQELLHDLFGARPLLAAAGRGILTEAETALLHRPRARAWDEVPWTAADIALLDEAAAILGPRRRRPTARRGDSRDAEAPEGAGLFAVVGGAGSAGDPAAGAAEEGIQAYGHIVVDEVQDLSPMQLRMLARRSISGSMTVVGDIAQATGASSPRSWTEVERHLGRGRPARRVELSVSYRTPAEVVEVAARVLAAAEPSLAPPVPARRSGFPPRIVEVERAALAGAVAEAAAMEIAALGEGRAAVLTPTVLLGPIQQALEERGLAPADPRQPGGPGLGAPLVVLPAGEANGLEFDSVVVVEPALLADAAGVEGPPAPSARGLRSLYVALTRPTRRLVVVHALPLPVPLAPG